jgi:hypothetical protein
MVGGSGVGGGDQMTQQQLNEVLSNAARTQRRKRR